MGIGHVAVGFASKRWAPNVSLGWLLLAPVFIDLLWAVFILTGLERARIVPGITKSVPLDLEYVPFSHSLVAATGWGLLLAGAYFALRRDARAAVVLFAGVVSHWLLDWISHRPDMPVLPSGPRVGLGLWDYPLAAFLVEAGMLAVGLWWYASATAPTARAGRIGLVVLGALLFALNIAAYTAAPPPDIGAMAGGNLMTLAFIAFAAYVDRRRAAVVDSDASATT